MSVGSSVAGEVPAPPLWLGSTRRPPEARSPCPGPRDLAPRARQAVARRAGLFPDFDAAARPAWSPFDRVVGWIVDRATL